MTRTYYRVTTRNSSGVSLHLDRDCQNLGLSPKPPTDVTREDYPDAPLCGRCGPEEWVCEVCGETFDCQEAYGGHYGNAHDTGGITAYDLADETVGPEDVGLSPIGASAGQTGGGVRGE